MLVSIYPEIDILIHFYFLVLAHPRAKNFTNYFTFRIQDYIPLGSVFEILLLSLDFLLSITGLLVRNFNFVSTLNPEQSDNWLSIFGFEISSLLSDEDVSTLLLDGCNVSISSSILSCNLKKRLLLYLHQLYRKIFGSLPKLNNGHHDSCSCHLKAFDISQNLQIIINVNIS